MDAHISAAHVIVLLVLAASKDFTLSTINVYSALVIAFPVKIQSVASHVITAIFYPTPPVFLAVHPVPSAQMNQFAIAVLLGIIYRIIPA